MNEGLASIKNAGHMPEYYLINNAQCQFLAVCSGGGKIEAFICITILLQKQIRCSNTNQITFNFSSEWFRHQFHTAVVNRVA
jgi:hypothetical protein